MNKKNNGRKKVFILIGILAITCTICVYVFFISQEGKTFTATIKKVSEYNGITSVLAEVEEENDLNLRGEFDFTIDADTVLLRKDQEIEISSLEVGQKVSITMEGEILEREPARLTEVTKVIVLED